MEEHVFLDGKRLVDQPALRACFFGEGVFETFRWKNSPPAFLSMHIDRMRRGSEFVGIPFPGEAEARHRIADAAATAAPDDLHIKACLLGEGDTSYPSRPHAGSFLVSVKPRATYPDTASLWISDQRRAPQYRLYSHKTLNYLGNIVAKREALANGFDDALFLDTDGNVAESSCHNIFWVSGTTLFTPSSDGPILPGVTREVVLGLADRLGLEPCCGSFPLEELVRSDFAFLTNAVAGIVYVSRVGIRSMPPAPRAFELVREALFLDMGW